MPIAPAKPSASVMIIRDVVGPPEVLLVRRNSEIAFHGGSWVFPGGKVDAADYDAAGDSDELEVARHTAIREVREEAGITVAKSDLRIFGHWTTPQNQPKRFATWFFATQIGADCEVEIDGSEIVDHCWISVDDALKRRARNEIVLPPPTFVSLLKLQRFSESAKYFDHLDRRGMERFVPKVVDVEHGRCSLYEEDAGYETLDLSAAGARHRLLMLESGWHYVREL